MEFAHGTIRRVGAAAVLTLVTLGVTPVGAADVILDATTGQTGGRLRSRERCRSE